MKGESYNQADVAAYFQKTVVDVLVDNAMKACKEKQVDKIAISGGVASNSYLRVELMERGESEGIKVLFPVPILCTDNAAYYEYKVGRIADLTLNAVPNLKLGQR